MEREIEAKFLNVDKDDLREMLKETGYKLKIPEYTMRRKTFDFGRVAPGVNKWGRVRQEANAVTMTIKEVRGTGIDDTYEVELTVENFDDACAFFEACNIPAKSTQENKRETWVKGEVDATIDTWPGLAPFVEIEGPNEGAVRSAAAELGFEFGNAVFGSIDLVYERERGIPASTIVVLPDITFANPPR
jgi:adenylate cyclase, class 2